MSYQETINKLEIDRSTLNYLRQKFYEDKDSLSRTELIFIIENMNINFDAIIDSLQIADLEKDNRTYPYCEDYGYSD